VDTATETAETDVQGPPDPDALNAAILLRLRTEGLFPDALAVSEERA